MKYRTKPTSHNSKVTLNQAPVNSWSIPLTQVDYSTFSPNQGQEIYRIQHLARNHFEICSYELQT